MLFNSQHFAILASISIFANALPFDAKARELVPRQKSYAIINVDGGSTEVAQATTIIKTTKTVEIVNPGTTVTQEVTATVEPAPKPTPTSTRTKCTSSASSFSSSPSPTSTSAAASTSIITSSASSSVSTPAETPKPIFVTVTIAKDDGPTEYYDNGLWHTSYRIKTFEKAAIAATPMISSSTVASSTSLPVLATSIQS